MVNHFEVKPLEPTPSKEMPVPVPIPPAPPPPPISKGESFFAKIISMKWIFLVIIIAVVLIALIVVFSGPFSESGVILEIEGPEQVQSGEEVVYKVHYENNSDADLENVGLSFLYPADSVVVKDGQIKESLTENVKLDVIPLGESGDLEFRAYVVGDTGDIKIAKARLSYKPSNIKSEFDKDASLSTTITSFAVPLTLSAPPNAISGQAVTYALDYRNESGGDLKDLRIKFRYPEGFSPASFNPSPDIGQDVWKITSLKRGGGARISVAGTLIGKEEADKTATVILQREIDGNNIDFEKTSATTVISSPPLLINVTVNERTDYVAKPGDLLHYKISFSNRSQTTLSGVNLVVKLEGNATDPTTYGGEGFFNASDNVVLWNAALIPQLANLRPGDSGEAEFSIRLKDPLPVSFNAKNFFVKLTASLETTNVPKEFDLDKLVVSQDLITKISTNLNFGQTAHYSDPAAGFVNTGPVPPKVGQQTTYTIHWTLDGTSSDIVNAKVTGFLPPGVTWTGNSTVNANQPSVVYEPSTGKVVWNIQVVPAGTGTVLPKYQAVFQVAINPTVAQEGQSVELIRDTEFEGQDGFTKEKIEKFAFRLTTDDVVDQRGKGAVE